ncbi:2-amino-4-hydroxy-6-hydroxymethyldihydropteridine diphosphokinase [bacterium]|nr:2-amino-4-hydroxy-6-hydroxymethyldihydropteridine diphosphokinase [bacterium]|tara:strand:+ start:3254 stop:3727 length:474 start_codon:yes stop_codon:yes gene_type:complete
MVSLIILLGSNIEPEYWSEKIISILKAHSSIEKIGKPWKTKAEGSFDAPDFINRAIKISGQKKIEDWKILFKEIEKKSGRQKSNDPNSPRTLDLDIVWFDGNWIDNPGLTRPYGIIPIADVAGGLKGPDGFDLKQLAAKLRKHPSILGISKNQASLR